MAPTTRWRGGYGGRHDAETRRSPRSASAPPGAAKVLEQHLFVAQAQDQARNVDQAREQHWNGTQVREQHQDEARIRAEHRGVATYENSCLDEPKQRTDGVAVTEGGARPSSAGCNDGETGSTPSPPSAPVRRTPHAEHRTNIDAHAPSSYHMHVSIICAVNPCHVPS